MVWAASALTRATSVICGGSDIARMPYVLHLHCKQRLGNILVIFTGRVYKSRVGSFVPSDDWKPQSSKEYFEQSENWPSCSG